MSIPETLNSLGGVIGPIGFLTATVFGTLYGKNKATIASLSDSNKAYEELVKARELQHQENQKRILVLEQKSEILENQVTQAPQINQLTLQLATQHKEIMQSFSTMTRELGNVAKAIATNKG